MEYTKFNESVIVRLDPGDEILGELSKVVRNERIMLGSVSGIGAINKVTLGLFKVAEKKYITKEFRGNYEIVSLSGLVSIKDGEPYFHLHMSIGDEDMHAYGGHLNEAYVSATAEILIRCTQGEIGRRYNDGIGLNLLNFSNKFE